MIVASLVCFLFGYTLGLPTGEIPASGFDIEIYPKLLQDPIGLGHQLIQWNKEGKTYLLSRNIALSYQAAKRTCEKYNMELVRIENEQQNATIHDLFEKYTTDGDGPFWMAGSRLTDQVTWRWPNDEPITFFNWARREPNNAKGDEMCIELYRDYVRWNDERCSIPNPFLCENIPNEDSSYQPILDSNDINGDLDDETTEKHLVVVPSSTPVHVPDFDGNSPVLPTVVDHVPDTDDDYEYDYGDDEYHSVPEPSEAVEPEAIYEKTTEGTVSEVHSDDTVSSTARPFVHKPPPPFIPPVDDEEEENIGSSDKESWSKPVLPSRTTFDDIEYRPKESDSTGWYEMSYYPPTNSHAVYHEHDHHDSFNGKEW